LFARTTSLCFFVNKRKNAKLPFAQLANGKEREVGREGGEKERELYIGGYGIYV
jgi:hypothetical protein